MRKIFFILICIVSTYPLLAQEPADALRYSWFSSGGTARQQSIGGAMGSLGGEISATFVNPAGIGFYKTGDFVVTPEFHFLQNKATYFGRSETDNRNGFSFGTTGAVLGFAETNPKKNLRGTSVCIAINQTANFGSNILYRGSNNQSSYSQKFLQEIANDKDANSVASSYPYSSSLALNTFWIDTVTGGTPGNYNFRSLAPVSTGLLQENVISNRGGITELGIAGAANYNDKFYIGGTLGIPFLYYKKRSIFTEADATSDPNNNFDFASITEDLTTQGVGINLRAGIIYKPVEYFRLGFAVHSPTYYFLTDKYSASVTTNTESFQGQLTQSSKDITSFDNAEFKYDLLNPYRLIASAAYVFREIEDVKKQRGFVTADIEYVNYKASSFHADSKGDNSESTKDYLKSLNRAIDNAYKAAVNFRLGGEIKFTTFMVRLGGAYYGNPYKDIAGEKGNRLQLTGGLGYRNKGMFIDFAYVHTMGKDVHYPYRLDSNNFSGASIKNTGGSAVISVGFKI